jgi:3-hydroxyacyl-[acyl-carrier-protein] dehydratase
MERLKEAIRRASLGPVHVTGDGSAVGRFRFEEGFAGFQGHFPGRPLLPAVAQITAALLVAGEAWGEAAVEAVSVDRAKFLLPLGPGEEIQVQCTRRDLAGGSELAVRVHGEEGLAGSFTVTLGEAAP